MSVFLVQQCDSPMYTWRVDQVKIENVLLREGVRLLKLSGPFTIKDIWDFQSAARR